MSLRGRYVIDKAKQFLSGVIALPVPPYGDPKYWDGCYNSLGPDDSFEWGNVSFEDMKDYSYKAINVESFGGRRMIIPSSTYTADATLGETLSAYPNSSTDENILMLGCGNSVFGEKMFNEGWKGPIVHVDVSSRVIESMSQRFQDSQRTGDMIFVQDDATALSKFSDGKAKAVFDKGLIDALFCANEYEQCYEVLSSVHRVLEPEGVFVWLSFSEPTFLLEKLVSPSSNSQALDLKKWQNVQVRKTSQIFVYRFQKAGRVAKLEIQPGSKRNKKSKQK